ncbi:MAG: hypothetical protein KDB00_00600 [Planctomycetales bacterium]|nr:hypothetical protein [Planctomycetales bacterium]
MADGSNAALITFGIYTLAVVFIAVLASRASKGKEFVGEYFLGSRSFGVWAFALTYAATNSSGGSFMGFPALIYTHGWSLALWIAAFMLSPLVGMGLIGKRLNQVARQSGALTIPEVLRERFASHRVGLVATAMLVFFMFFYLLAQFKAGGKILSTLLSGEPMFQRSVAGIAELTAGIPWVNRAEPDYLLCLIVFSFAVILYVVYGGFRAVVWTDVMQGIVMFVGVILMLGLALYQVGGLANATRQMAKMTPPENGTAILSVDEVSDKEIVIPKGTWIKQQGNAYRLAALTLIAPGETSSPPTAILKITTAFEIESIQSDPAARGISVEVIETTAYMYGAGRPGVYLQSPGPSAKSGFGFLAVGTAISFFIFWPFAGAGQPSNMVRLMSFKDTRTLRYSIVTVAIYYSIIYFSLVLIFCCGRVLMPGMEIDPDRTMPDLATLLTRNAGMPWLAGLLVAAPFAAVMSSVDSFLLMVSSSVVRDIYQGHINPAAPERNLKWLSYGVTVVIGVLAVLVVLNPPKYLQDLIVFASGGLAACFLIPIVLSLYWRRMTASGAIAGMVAGMLVHLGLTCWGYYEHQEFRAYEFMGLDPFVWDLAGSAIGAVLFSLVGNPNAHLVRKYFDQPGDC